MLISLTDVWKTYPMGRVSVDALRGVNLSLEAGEFTAVVGRSGAGKTTMMNIIGLIDRPTSGAVVLDGRDTGALSRRGIVRLRQEVIGFIFQSFNLLPVLSVFENVELPLLVSRAPLSRAERKMRVDFLLEAVGLSARARHKPPELSGGEQQRTAIARSLVNRPRVIIADEPTANLDFETGTRILGLLKDMSREEGTTLVFSTHDAKIREMAGHVVFVKDGKIESEERR